MEISFQVDPDRSFDKALKALAKVTSDFRVPLQKIAEDFYRTQKPIFEMKGPGPYPDLSTLYKIRKRRLYGFIYPILKANGRLAKAASEQGASGNITEINETDVSFGVNENTIPYAAFHQSDAPRRKIPLRKFLFIGPEAPQFASSDQMRRVSRWTQILNSFMMEKMKQTGAGKVES